MPDVCCSTCVSERSVNVQGAQRCRPYILREARAPASTRAAMSGRAEPPPAFPAAAPSPLAVEGGASMMGGAVITDRPARRCDDTPPCDEVGERADKPPRRLPRMAVAIPSAMGATARVSRADDTRRFFGRALGRGAASLQDHAAPHESVSTELYSSTKGLRVDCKTSAYSSESSMSLPELLVEESLRFPTSGMAM